MPGHYVFIMPNAIKGSGNKEDKPSEMPALADPANPFGRDDLMRKAAAADDPLAKEWAMKNGLE